jgi:hypothetical protein
MIKPGVLDAPTQAVDLFPTILAIAGGSPSADIDGLDLRKSSSFATRSMPLELSKRYIVIRSGKWQLVGSREDSGEHDGREARRPAPAAPVKPATLSRLADRMTALMSDDPATWTPTTSSTTSTGSVADDQPRGSNPDIGQNQLIDEIRSTSARPAARQAPAGRIRAVLAGSGASGLFTQLRRTVASSPAAKRTATTERGRRPRGGRDEPANPAIPSKGTSGEIEPPQNAGPPAAGARTRVRGQAQRAGADAAVAAVRARRAAGTRASAARARRRRRDDGDGPPIS